MTANPACLHLLRVTLEAVTPLSLASGQSRRVERGTRGRDGDKEDVKGTIVDLMRDANGLPTIPGSSLQGALRTLHHVAYGKDDTDALFGFAKGDDGKAARLIVGFGSTHDERDRAVIGLRRITGGDAVLDLLMNEEPLRRDHVALDHRHVVDGRKKFERLAVPGGTRFSFELALWGTSESREADVEGLKRIAALLGHPAFRIGGASRRGYGRVRPVLITHAEPDLDDTDGLRGLRGEPPSKGLATPWPTEAAGVSAHTIATLTLTPINPWRIGGGSADGGAGDGRWRNPPLTPNTRGFRALTEGARPGDPHETVGLRRPETKKPLPPAMAQGERLDDGETRDGTAVLLREPVIVWAGGKGQVRRVATPADDRRVAEDFVVPGSAVKGPLAHRTLFHWNRAKGEFVDADAPMDDAALTSLAARPEGLTTLLGAAKERRAKAPAGSGAAPAAAPGRAARLLVEDGTVTGAADVMAFDHNVIDRFTGGVIDRLFHTEETLVGGTIELRLIIAPCDDMGSDWPDDVVSAFCAALSDLCRGRLAIGAKSLGFCQGTISWTGDNAEQWNTAFGAAPAHGKAA